MTPRESRSLVKYIRPGKKGGNEQNSGYADKENRHSVVFSKAGAGIHCHHTSLKSVSNHEKQIWGIVYESKHSPKIEFDVQDESKPPLALLFFCSLRLIQSKCPPTVPHSASLSFRPSSSLAVKEKCSCVKSFGLNEKNQPIWLTFPGQSYNFSCCQGLTSRPEQFLGLSHMHPTGQWGLSYSHIPHRGPIACLPTCGSIQT